MFSATTVQKILQILGHLNHFMLDTLWLCLNLFNVMHANWALQYAGAIPSDKSKKTGTVCNM